MREPEFEVVPLEPAQVDALLRPDTRSFAADLFELRDSLHRMSTAFERLAESAERLRDLLDSRCYLVTNRAVKGE